MAPKKNLSAKAKTLAERVRGALKAEVRRRDFRLIDLEAALGRSHGYFSHLFGGRLALNMEGVLEILLAIDADPAEFFAEAFGPERPKGRGPSPEDIETTVQRLLKRYGYVPEGKVAEKEGNSQP